MAIASWGLLTLQDAKEHLSVSGNEFDPAIEGLVESATLLVEGECDRLLFSRTYTAEIYDATGGLALELRQYPVTAVSSVELLSGGPPDEWTVYSPATYGLYIPQPRADGFAFRNLWMQRGCQNVRVTYTAGYTADTMPRALKDAARIALKALWDVRDKQNAGIASQSMPGGQTVVYDKEALPRIFSRLCDPYKRLAWV